MALQTSIYTPGSRVRITQQIARTNRKPWTITIDGVVESYEVSKTGSWFAHAKDDRLWLERLTLRRDDGEEVVCNLDRYSHIELLEPAPENGSAPEGRAPEQA
jgi:hypothetical protein